MTDQKSNCCCNTGNVCPTHGESDTPKTDLHANLSLGSMMRASHAYEFARELERELAAMTKDRDTLRARVAELEKGEYICRKCGLRKDGEGEKGDF